MDIPNYVTCYHQIIDVLVAVIRLEQQMDTTQSGVVDVEETFGVTMMFSRSCSFVLVPFESFFLRSKLRDISDR
jgi:hypothetical protein